jgi:RimJ/RimL family protein N-acetyltransferase
MKTNRIKLINCDVKLLESVIKGQIFFKNKLQVNIADCWSEFGKDIFEFVLDKIKARPETNIWWTYFPILIETNTLIGSCGFKGAPDKNGLVELGYEIAPSYRNKGLATEITNSLLNKAFENNHVTEVIAHTLASENASVKVLKKCGFTYVKELQDEEDGTIWKWSKLK